METASFDIPLFKSLLKTHWAGRSLHLLSSCDSTNERVRALEPDRRASGTLVLAENQTHGRGRWGRRWQGGQGQSLLMTLVLPLPPQGVPAGRISVAVGLAVARQCEAACGESIRLKWPNDLMARSKKLAGLLIERLPEGLATGIGINVSQGPEDFDPSIRDQAISLASLAGRPRGREALLAAILLEIEDVLDQVDKGFEKLKQEWHRRAMYLGDPVRVKVAGEAGGEVEGTLMGLDWDGALLLRQDQGVILPVAAGDLLNLRPVLT